MGYNYNFSHNSATVYEDISFCVDYKGAIPHESNVISKTLQKTNKQIIHTNPN